MKNKSFMWDLTGLYGDEWGFNEQTWGKLFWNDPTRMRHGKRWEIPTRMDVYSWEDHRSK